MVERQQYDIVIPGNYYCDLIFTGLPKFPELGQEIFTQGVSVVPGGGALNSAIALQRLGVKVGWAGQLGTDFFSEFIKHWIEQEGLDLSLVTRINEPMRRVTVSLSFPQDRAFVSYVDATLSSTDFILAIMERIDFRHLHFAGLVVDPRVPGLMDMCHQRGITVSMDCQHREQTIHDPLILEILCKLDIFMPNASEAQRLTETNTVQEALTILGSYIPHVVIKNGDQGALACHQGRKYASPAIPVETVIDTTGAGDVFNAGFLAAYLRGYDEEECLRWGNFCGGCSIQGVGGPSAAPYQTQLQDWLDSQP